MKKLLITLLLLAPLTVLAESVPVFPMSFYGNVSINSSAAPVFFQNFVIAGRRDGLTLASSAEAGAPIDFASAFTCRLDSAVEVNYFRNGGILQTVLRKLLNESRKPAMA